MEIPYNQCPSVPGHECRAAMEDTHEDPRLLFLQDHVLRALKLKPERWSKCVSGEENRTLLLDFLDKSDPKTLLVTLTAAGALQPVDTITASSKSKAVYFVKRRQTALKAESMKESLVYGELSYAPLEHFSALVEQVLVPLLSNSRNHTDWPHVVSQDIRRHLHSLQSSVFGVCGSVQGKTLLPPPDGAERLDQAVPQEYNSVKTVDKSLIHSLESSVIGWIHQVHAVLNRDSSEELLRGSHPTPQTELLFWDSRRADLECIYSQLTSTRAQKMAAVLEAVQSSYTDSFNSLRRDVLQALEEAWDVCAHLKPLQRLLQDLEEAEFPQVKGHMAPLMHTVCLLWARSRFYCRPARIIVLLQEMCNLLLQQEVVLTAVDLFKLEKLEMGGVKGHILSQHIQTLHQNFVELYKNFTEKSSSCLDLSNTEFDADVRHFKLQVEDTDRRLGAVFCQAFDSAPALEHAFKSSPLLITVLQTFYSSQSSTLEPPTSTHHSPPNLLLITVPPHTSPPNSTFLTFYSSQSTSLITVLPYSSQFLFSLQTFYSSQSSKLLMLAEVSGVHSAPPIIGSTTPNRWKWIRDVILARHGSNPTFPWPQESMARRGKPLLSRQTTSKSTRPQACVTGRTVSRSETGETVPVKSAQNRTLFARHSSKPSTHHSPPNSYSSQSSKPSTHHSPPNLLLITVLQRSHHSPPNLLTQSSKPLLITVLLTSYSSQSSKPSTHHSLQTFYSSQSSNLLLITVSRPDAPLGSFCVAPGTCCSCPHLLLCPGPVLSANLCLPRSVPLPTRSCPLSCPPYPLFIFLSAPYPLSCPLPVPAPCCRCPRSHLRCPASLFLLSCLTLSTPCLPTAAAPTVSAACSLPAVCPMSCQPAHCPARCHCLQCLLTSQNANIKSCLLSYPHRCLLPACCPVRCSVRSCPLSVRSLPAVLPAVLSARCPLSCPLPARFSARPCCCPVRSGPLFCHPLSCLPARCPVRSLPAPYCCPVLLPTRCPVTPCRCPVLPVRCHVCSLLAVLSAPYPLSCSSACPLPLSCLLLPLSCPSLFAVTVCSLFAHSWSPVNKNMPAVSGGLRWVQELKRRIQGPFSMSDSCPAPGVCAEEVKYLQSGQTEAIPEAASQLYCSRDRLWKYVINLELITKHYNKVMCSVLEVELPLIQTQIQVLDSEISKAEEELHWNSEDVWPYIQNLRDQVCELDSRLQRSKENVEEIQRSTGVWSSPVFERREGRTDTLLGLDEQHERVQRFYSLVQSSGDKIHFLIKSNRELLRAEPASEAWRAYLDYIDDMIIDGFFNSIQASLHFLLDNTDQNISSPLLELQLELRVPELVFSPSVEGGAGDSVQEKVDALVTDVFRMSSLVPRVAQHCSAPHYQADMEDMADLQDLRAQLSSRVQSAVAACCQYRNSLEPYAYLYVEDRREFMRQFLLYGHVLSSHEMEMYADSSVPESPPTLDSFREQVDG
ncbi:hypothetical protein WMY93_010394 [Mugilogobius chulae]|uniref:Dynein heavy chain tail domain-containing protein n=1 Tax=Mugilogobius chulae TaxID=88201 RepID=A0AAW0P7A9_9GOBI